MHFISVINDIYNCKKCIILRVDGHTSLKFDQNWKKWTYYNKSNSVSGVR